MADADEAQAMAREMTLLRAQTLAQSGRAAEAHGLLTRLWAEDPKALTAGFAVCEAAILAGDTPTAIDAFSKMKAHDPSDCRVHELEREIGLILFGRNQWETAAPLLSAAHLREPWDRGLARAAARAARPDYLAAEIDDPVTGGANVVMAHAREGGMSL
ncbi:tetratricopeptide repeat protein [Roseobacteraceae bacterium S113]